MDLTLLEVNLEEPSFRANAPFSGGSRDADDESATDVDVDYDDASDDSSRSGPSAKSFVVGLVFLVAVGLAARRFMGGDSGAVEEEPDPERITA